MNAPLLSSPLVAVLLLADPASVTALSDLPGALTERLGDALPADLEGQLDAVFAAGSYRFDSRYLTVRTDRRWYATQPDPVDGAPFLVLRRWPGDSVLAFYVLRPGAAAPGPVAACPLDDPVAAGEGQWSGTLGTALGRGPASWRELQAPGDPPPGRVGVLSVPGTAGFGAEGRAALARELERAATRIEWRPDGWRAPPAFADAAGGLRVPEVGGVVADADEGRDPWQIARGAGFTLGLPPGVLARNTAGPVGERYAVPDGGLWIRGRFTDRDRLRVVVGDGQRAGYVAGGSGRGGDWAAGDAPPAAGGPGWTRAANAPFPALSGWTGCRTGVVQRWHEPGFDGDWLVFRMHWSSGAWVEIGLPVLEGRRSLALYWIPASWRGVGEPPAPPPVDPAARFGIRFEPETGGRGHDHPFTAGYLSVPGLRLAVSSGWWPIATLRSPDGFPIRLVDRAGATVGVLTRLGAESLAALVAQPGWSVDEAPRRSRAERVWRGASGSRVFATAEGDGFHLARESEAQGAAWERMAESVRLDRTEKKRPGR